MPSSFYPRTTQLRGFSASLLLAVFLLLCMHQTLGLVHAVVHGHGDHAQEVGSQLFSGHDDDSPDCRLYDQSGHCDAMVHVPPMVLPLAIAPFVFSILAGLVIARWHALFQARGPPLIR